MNKEQIKAVIQAQLSEKRYAHTLRVVEEAKKLAKTYGVSVEKAELAALCHDYAKEWDTDRLKQIILNSDLPKNLLLFHPELWHGPVASVLLKETFAITDEEIINAVRYHTTGRANMSPLELIIFVADYIEPGRRFSGLSDVRNIAYEHLELTAWHVARNTLQYLLSKKATIYPDSFHAYNDLTMFMSEQERLEDNE